MAEVQFWVSETLAARSISVATTLTGTAAAFAFLYFFRPVLVPFVGAFVLAVLVSGLVRWIRDRSPKAPGRAVSLIAGLVVIIAASAALFVMGQGMVQMVAQGPALMERIDGLVQSVGQSFHLKEQLHLTNLIGSVSVPQIAGFVLSSVQGLASGVLLMIVYFGFMLAGRERMNNKLDHFEGSQGRAKTIRRIVVKIAQDLFTYIWVQTITGTILTVAAAAVMLAVGLNNILFWCVVFFLLTFIPIGVTVGSVAPALFALLQFPTLWQAITIFAVIQIVATVVGNMIYPRLQRKTEYRSPSDHPLAVLLDIAVGLAGAFLAVPLTLMTMTVFAQFESTKWVAALLSNDGKIDS